MAVVIICSDFGAQVKKVSHCFHWGPLLDPRGSYKKGHLVNSDVLKFTEDMAKTPSFFDFGVSLVLQLESERLTDLTNYPFFPHKLPRWFVGFYFNQEKEEKVKAVTDFLLLAPTLLQIMTEAMILRDTCSLERKL